MNNLDLRKIEKLIELIRETDVTELEIREGETSVRIHRGALNIPIATTSYIQAPTPELQIQPTAKSKEETQTLPSDQHIIRSPMVGTFYISPSPKAKAFIEIGQQVKAGDVLCIVEAMKMMNQIESDKDGVVVQRLIENGMPVEFDQPLFVIE